MPYNEPTFVSYLDYFVASGRWREVTDDKGALHRFLAGIDEYRDGTTFQLSVSELTQRRIRLLLGPHYHAIIKAYLAKEANHG